jgi:O-acetylserine/cysteine efflux transporter
MRVRDMISAALVSVTWGFAFVTYPFGLESFSPLQLTALRFLLASLPAFLVPRPKTSWRSIALIGLTLFAGQFLLLFYAFTRGMPAGLASVTQQMQVFFTILLAAVFLREFPSGRQCIGLALALAGLTLIGLTTGTELPPIALVLALGAAFCWAIGNILVKREANVSVFPLMVWCSLVPLLPALIMSSVYDEQPLTRAIAAASWPSMAAVVYLGIPASIMAYAIWGFLLQRYPTARVAPFALLSPCTGVLASALIIGEAPGPMRYAGMALIVAGLVVILVRRGNRNHSPCRPA